MIRVTTATGTFPVAYGANSFTLNSSLRGYTPVMATMFHNLSAVTLASIEGVSFKNGSASASGFTSLVAPGNSGTIYITVQFLWVKNL